MPRIISIDPGKEGALTYIQYQDLSSKLIATLVMPNLSTHQGRDTLMITLSRWVADGVDIIIIEEQGSRGGTSAQSSFSHGRNYGMLEMAISAALSKSNTLPQITYVSPSVWMKGLPPILIREDLLPLKMKDTKKRTLSLASSMYPKACLKGKRGKHLDGVADALMLGWWTYITDLITAPNQLRRLVNELQPMERNQKDYNSIIADINRLEPILSELMNDLFTLTDTPLGVSSEVNVIESLAHTNRLRSHLRALINDSLDYL